MRSRQVGEKPPKPLHYSRVAAMLELDAHAHPDRTLRECRLRILRRFANEVRP